MSALRHILHPYHPSLGARTIEVPAGMSVEAAIVMSGWKLPARTVLLRPDAARAATLRDALVPRSAWATVAVNDNAPTILLTIDPPEGNKGASQIAAIVASLALAVFAPVIGGFALTQLGIAGTSTVLGVSASSIATATVFTGGQYLISSLLPAPKPFAPSNDVSPTYSLAAQSNRARLSDPEPELLGQHMVMCDLISAPYVDYVGNKQRVMQVFCVSKGDVQVEQIRAGSSVLWLNGSVGGFADVEIEVCQPSEPVTLFHDNVVSSTDVSGVAVLGTNEEDTGEVGPFIGSGPGQYAQNYEIDILVTLFSQDGDGHIQNATIEWMLEYQVVDNNGLPIGGWISVIEEELTLARRTPQRRTYQFTIATPGRHRFRMRRTNSKSTESGTSDTLQWIGLRAFLPSKPDYSRLTKIAIRATATANLNADALQKINVIGTRKLIAWDAEEGAWTDEPVATRQIAAAARYCCEAKLGRPPSKIALDLLASLQETWTARGDEFNGVIDARQSAWEVLQTILRTGRAEPVIAGTQIAFVRDEAKVVPGAAFSPRNMLAQSFNVDYSFSDGTAADAVLVEFIDRRSWTANTVLAKLPGSTATVDTAPRIQAPKGITDRSHAWREAMFILADTAYRRRVAKFKTHLEGRACFKGMPITTAHWLTGWGQTADVIALDEGEQDGDTYCDVLTLNQPYERPADAGDDDNLIQIATPDGNVYGPVPFDVMDDGLVTGMTMVRLTDHADVAGKYAGQQPRDWGDWAGGELHLVRDGGERVQIEPPRATLGVGAQVARLAIVRSMKPDAGSRVAAVEAVIEDARVHQADAGDPPEEIGGPESDLGTNLVIASVTIAESSPGGGLNRVQFTVVGATDAASFDMQWRHPTDAAFGDPHRDLARTFHQDWSPAQNVVVQIRARGAAGFGPWFEITVRADGTADTIPADVVTIAGVFNSEDETATTYTITPVTGAVGYVIRKWARVGGSDDFERVGDEFRILTNAWTYYAGDEIDDGGPFHNFYIQVKAFNNAGVSVNWKDSDDGT